MEEYMGYKIVAIPGNTHIDMEIAEAVRRGGLWIWAVPRIPPYFMCPNPTHLIFSSVTMDQDDAQRIFEAWDASKQNGS